MRSVRVEYSFWTKGSKHHHTLVSRDFLELPSVPDCAFEHGQPLSEFGYGQISFALGLHENQREQIHTVLASLSEYSLLRPYGARAGLSAPRCDLSGWYSSAGFCEETLGQWISAFSRFHAISPGWAVSPSVSATESV